MTENVASFLTEFAELLEKYPHVGICGDSQGECGLVITFPDRRVVDLTNEQCGFLPEALREIASKIRPLGV